jgi:MerR family transcriptional regulator, light-induced transcriptional regulator
MIPRDSLATHYLQRLLAFDQEGAQRLLRRALDAGLPLRALYLDVLEPVQHQIGELWVANRLSIADEHYCTAITQLVLAEAYPRVIRASERGPRVVASCVPGELHEIGGRMVADFFQLDGWDAVYLGEPARCEQVLCALRETRAQLLALSVTMPFNLPSAAEIITRVRARAEFDHVKILLGGRALTLSERTFRELGADGTATRADRAVELGRKLITQPSGLSLDEA